MFLFSSPSLSDLEGVPNPVPALILVVLNAIMEVFLLCAVGWILAKRGIVDSRAKKTLNTLNVSLFTPALLFSKVAFSLSPDKLRDLAIIPIGFFIITGFSAGVAYIFGSVMRLKPRQRNFAVACAMFQNSNSLPIALMQSLIGEKMPLKWGPHDSQDSMLARALSYLVLFSTLGIIIRWSVGVRLLTSAEADASGFDSAIESGIHVPRSAYRPDEQPSEGVPSTLESNTKQNGNGALRSRRSDVTFATASTVYLPDSSSTSQDPSPPASRATVHTKQGDRTTLLLADADAALSQEALLRPHDLRPKPRPQSIFHSFPSTPRPRSVIDSVNDEDEEEWERDTTTEVREGWSAKWEEIKYRVERGSRGFRKVCKRIGQFMTVPLWAALMSLFVACVPPLQAGLNEVEPLKAALKMAGNCSVPITLVTLGAYFYRPSPSNPAPLGLPPSEPASFLARLNPFRRREVNEFQHVERPGPGETRTVLVAVISRMVLVPLVLLPLFGWYASFTTNVADDPVFVVVACLLIGSPTAITLAQITSSTSGRTFELLISRTLFVSYAIMTAPCTIALVLTALYIDRNQ